MTAPHDPALISTPPPKPEYPIDSGAIRILLWTIVGLTSIAVVVGARPSSGFDSWMPTTRSAAHVFFGSASTLLVMATFGLGLWHVIRPSMKSLIAVWLLLVAWLAWTSFGTVSMASTPVENPFGRTQEMRAMSTSQAKFWDVIGIIVPGLGGLFVTGLLLARRVPQEEPADRTHYPAH